MDLHPIWAVMLWIGTMIGMTGIPPVDPPLPDLISISPDPPVAGQPLKICFAFSKGDPSPIDLNVEFTTSNGVTSQIVQVSESQPCATITVPSDGFGITITDPTGTAADFGRVF